ncbi:MAG: PEP-CTERM sorting domain-containing protein [Rubrivivax sp.]
MKTFTTLAAALACAGLTLSAQAVPDPAGDLLASFTGTKSAGLDLIDADVSFDSSSETFTVRARTLGAIADLETGAFVFGFHRGGTASQPFGPIGFDDIAFNATALLRSDGSGNVGGTAIEVEVDGDTVSAQLPASLLPSQGLAPQDYTWALWSVDLAVTGLPRNADFISTSNLNVNVVPEPTGLALLMAGISAIGFTMRARQRR